MKLLHTSDWHLGASDSDRMLYDDQKFFIDEICEISKTENIDAVIIAGDIYDKSIASADAIGLYDYAMTRLCVEMGKEVIVIAGNHDSGGRLSGCKDLLKQSGLHVVGFPEKKPCVINYPDTDIYLFPWITEEKIKGLYPDKRDEICSLTDAYRVVCDDARTCFDASKRQIAVAHAFVTNAQLSGSDKAAQIAAIGNAMQVDADVFEGFDYVALGHIHGPQDINDTLRYSGTPMPYSFGREENQDKSVTIIDTATMERKIIGLELLHQRKTLTNTFDELLKGDYADEIKKGYVRLEVTDSYVGLEAIAQLRAVYPNFLEIKGKSYEVENSQIRMTIDEFNKIENNPMEIFRSYCRDIIDMEPDEHISSIFAQCIEEDE